MIEIPLIDIFHFLALCRFLNERPVPYAQMVEVKRSTRPTFDNPDLPPPADEPQSVIELASMLNGLARG